MSRKSIEEYRRDEEIPIIGIDFDGVIHDDDKGFHDGTIYGNVIKGSKESLKILSSKFNLVIYSAKVRQDRPLINGKSGKELIWEWLRNNDLDQYISLVTSEKPRATLYIDDKAIKFIDWNETLKEMGRCGLPLD